MAVNVSPLKRKKSILVDTMRTFLILISIVSFHSTLCWAQHERGSIQKKLAATKLGMSVAELKKIIGKPSFEADQGNGSLRLEFREDPDKKGSLVGFVVLIEDGKVARVLPIIRDYPLISEGTGHIIGYLPADELAPVDLIEKIQLHGDLTKISERDLSMIASVVLATLSKNKDEPKADATVSSESRLIKALRHQHPGKLQVHAGDRVKLLDVIQALRISEKRGPQ